MFLVYSLFIWLLLCCRWFHFLFLKACLLILFFTITVFVCKCLFNYLSVCFSIYLSIHLPTKLPPIYLSIHFSIYPSLFISLSLSLFPSLFFSLSFSLFLSLPLCPPVFKKFSLYYHYLCQSIHLFCPFAYLCIHLAVHFHSSLSVYLSIRLSI